LETLYQRLLKIEDGLKIAKLAEEKQRDEVSFAVHAPIMQVGNAAPNFPIPSVQPQQGRNQNTLFPKGSCFKCGSPEHWANVCPLRMALVANQAGNNNGRPAANNNGRAQGCFRCGDLNHRKANCPNNKQGCYLCNDTSHIKANCPNRFCQLCNQRGHWQHECIKFLTPTANPNNTETKNL